MDEFETVILLENLKHSPPGYLDFQDAVDRLIPVNGTIEELEKNQQKNTVRYKELKHAAKTYMDAFMVHQKE